VTTFAERIREEAQAEVARLTEFRASLQKALAEADRELAEAQAILAIASGKEAPEPTPSEPHTEQVLPGTPPPEVLPPQQADEAREKAAQEERDRETVAAGAGPTVQERSDAAERLKQHVDSELESARKDDSQGGRKLAAVPEPTEPSAPERPDWLGKVETGDEGWFKATAAAAASKRSTADVRAELAQLTDAKILATRGQGFDLEYRIVPKSTREVNKDLLSLESVRDWVVEQKEPFAGTHYLKAKNLPPAPVPRSAPTFRPWAGRASSSAPRARRPWAAARGGSTCRRRTTRRPPAPEASSASQPWTHLSAGRQSRTRAPPSADPAGPAWTGSGRSRASASPGPAPRPSSVQCPAFVRLSGESAPPVPGWVAGSIPAGGVAVSHPPPVAHR
jgi:hypothetical protein